MSLDSLNVEIHFQAPNPCNDGIWVAEPAAAVWLSSAPRGWDGRGSPEQSPCPGPRQWGWPLWSSLWVQHLLAPSLSQLPTEIKPSSLAWRSALARLCLVSSPRRILPSPYASKGVGAGPAPHFQVQALSVLLLAIALPYILPGSTGFDWPKLKLPPWKRRE